MFDVIRAYAMAKECHEKQKDQAGKKYIKHPLYVARHVKGRKAKVVALLHDVVEDSYMSVNVIREAFGDDVANAVELLTHDKKKSYMEYIFAIKENALARKVKIQDLIHNINLCRLKRVYLDDAKRTAKYAWALEELLKDEPRC